jgi:hypothetical protein
LRCKFNKKLKSANLFRKVLIICLLYGLFSGMVRAQGRIGFFTPAPQVDNNRLIPLVASQGALYATSMIGLNLLWYKNYPHSRFHLFDDNKEWLQMDKFGHALTAFTISRLTTALYHWCGVNIHTSSGYATALAMAYQTNIEVFDGFSSAWGFSLGDMTANTLGAALFLGQQAVWDDQRITMKISFHPTDYAQYRPDELGDNFVERSIKDYNGQTYWFAFAIASFFPKGNKIPNWLCLDFGYGAEGMVGGTENPIVYNSNGDEMFFTRYRQFYCSLDIDLTRIVSTPGPLKTALSAISFIKVPAPTLEFSRKKLKFHILYF